MGSVFFEKLTHKKYEQKCPFKNSSDLSGYRNFLFLLTAITILNIQKIDKQKCPFKNRRIFWMTEMSFYSKNTAEVS